MFNISISILFTYLLILLLYVNDSVLNELDFVLCLLCILTGSGGFETYMVWLKKFKYLMASKRI